MPSLPTDSKNTLMTIENEAPIANCIETEVTSEENKIEPFRDSDTSSLQEGSLNEEFKDAVRAELESQISTGGLARGTLEQNHELKSPKLLKLQERFERAVKQLVDELQGQGRQRGVQFGPSLTCARTAAEKAHYSIPYHIPGCENSS